MRLNYRYNWLYVTVYVVNKLFFQNYRVHHVRVFLLSLINGYCNYVLPIFKILDVYRFPAEHNKRVSLTWYSLILPYIPNTRRKPFSTFM